MLGPCLRGGLNFKGSRITIHTLKRSVNFLVSLRPSGASFLVCNNRPIVAHLSANHCVAGAGVQFTDGTGETIGLASANQQRYLSDSTAIPPQSWCSYVVSLFP